MVIPEHGYSVFSFFFDLASKEKNLKGCTFSFSD